MLKATEFDLKTGQILTEYDSDAAAVGQRRPKVQEIEHSYLERWFEHHNLEPPSLFVAQFYPGVNPADQERLANDGRVLFSTNGAKGYFTDPETAALIGQGDPERGIEPVYAADLNRAHNAVAYGSLMLSDGKASHVLQNESQLPIRILVVDDEQRDVGGLLTDFQTGQPLESDRVEPLLDRMGDGTMLVTPSVMENLVMPQDIQASVKQVLKDAQPEEIERLAALYWEQGSFEGKDFNPKLMSDLDEAIQQNLNQTVIQFRAATPDFPGIAKGTLTASQFLEDLGVDLVISANDIKGDDGRFSRPGLHEVERFWLNRKSDARHRTQVVGPQVKGTIPEATASELNPKALARLDQLNQAATDPHQLAQAYVAAKQKQQMDTEALNEKPDWLATVLAADAYGTLDRFPSVVDRLERWLRGERVEIALNGNEIPSATAQHHSQLKPWEVCHPQLKDGALVAFYRSPFPNAGAAAIAINNRSALQAVDEEAYEKKGVAYLNPWTAKTIAITDFDGDANGFFVGFEDKTKGGLAAQLREQFSDLAGESPAVQYEAARATFARLIEQQGKDPEQSPLRPADYPQVVQAFVNQNAPENKPPAITKQAKVKHAWNPDAERLDQAIWRAWEVTANNPIGRVANTGMVLQSFANECAHGSRDRAGLAGQVSQAYRKVLKQVDQGKLALPSDGQLAAQGLPALNLRSRLERIAGGEQSTEQTLADTHDLLMDVANGPVALNLQTAVDIAKSSRGIDEGLQQLARALQYKTHELRAARKNPQIYTQDQVFPVNTDEPTAWMVEAVNAAYEVTQLPRIEDKIAKAFGPLVSGEVVPEQAQAAQQLCDHYYGLVGEQTQAARRLAQQEPRALEQPSLLLTSASSGKTIQVERLIDGLEGKNFDWRVQGQTDWQVTIRRDEAGKGLVVERGQAGQRLGWVNPVSAREAGLEQAVAQKGQVVLNAPDVQLQPPARLENDLDELRAKPQQYLEEVAQDWGTAEQETMAAALWQTNIERPGQTQARMGMNLAMRILPEQIAEQLSQGPPPIYVSRSPEVEVMPKGQFTAQIQAVKEPNKTGQRVERLAVFQQQEDGEPIRLGLLAGGTVQLAPGIEAKASMQETWVQAAKMTVTTPTGDIAVTKVQQFDFGETSFQGQSATLQLQSSPSGIQVKVVQADGELKTLGRLGADNQVGRAAARQLWREQGEQPWESTLERSSYPKLELKIEGDGEFAQARTFEQAWASQQQGEQVSPSYRELQQWWQVAHAQEQPELQAEVKQRGERLVLAWQEQGHSSSPPPNFRSAEVVLEPQQAEQMQQALGWHQQQHPAYSPSYQELQGLWRIAGQQGRRELQQKVGELGQQLVAAFQFESGSWEKPGAEYRSGDVQLGVAERGAVYAVSQQQSLSDTPRERGKER